ncbi:MAG: adenylate/guanylate cyclase domain-containing response regulator [Bradyrhizobiaceae bacterium]|nr:MAG: adenylate/guanylate cyclase domain-containing response regulator [Bradyrhizobiaceae bacterium]
MRSPPRILAVDDAPANLEILRVRLESQGYEVVTATDGEQALERVAELEPDLVLLDIMMPKLDGISVVKRLKGDARQRFVPVILVTAKADTRDIVAGLEAGGDDYLTKPFEHAALMARVRSLLRIKELHDTVHEQAARLEQQAKELAEWNTVLEQRVAEQTAEIERTARLRRFLAPQVVEMISSGDASDAALESHRREITVLFCDLRGFTAFTESSDPEEVMSVLREYHEGVGKLIFEFEGTLERFLGDGIMIVFNDPIPAADHCDRAIRLAIAMRDRVGSLATKWRAHGHNLGFGIGIATGYATLGLIGFDRRREYTAIGRVTNLASRLCDEAKPGQIVVAQRTFSAAQPRAKGQALGELVLKGFSNPTPAYEVLRWDAE